MNFDKVAADNFYKDDGDKVKQNWFLYEYSNVLFSKIMESPSLQTYRKNNNEESISAFCVYFSKRMRLSINNVQKSKTSGAVIDAKYVYEYYPGNSRAQTQRLIEAAQEAWNEHLLTCSDCPNRCITDGFEITDMFDNLEKAGWPTV